MTLDEVLDAHGKATDAEYSDAYEEDKPDLLDLTYRKENTDGNNYVRLTFEKKRRCLCFEICLSNLRL